MSLKSAMTFGLAIGVVGTGLASASNARIESMGKNSAYVMDDVSIFDNPANINIYPNFLIGEFGPYQDNNLGTGNNKDPMHPWFGGIFSLALGQEDSRDPRLSIAGAFNRRDEKLYSYLPDSVRVLNNTSTGFTTVPVPLPVTNFDGFLGGTMPNGNAGGLHIYIAQQQGGVENNTGYSVEKDAFSSLFKVDAGINIQLNTDVDAEVSAGLARVQYGPAKRDLVDGDLMSVFGAARLFSTWSLINGELVPAASWSYIKAPGIDDKQLIGGMGVNVALDRGFFWLGADFMYGLTRMQDFQINTSNGNRVYVEDGNTSSWDIKESWGGRISFGIERNIWYDWLVIRVGGMKVIQYVDCAHNDDNSIPAAQASQGYSTLCPEDGNYFYTNPSGDGSQNDHVGFGFGINIEEKLKVDFTMAEDVIFRNPFQGEGRLMSRISATYSF